MKITEYYPNALRKKNSSSDEKEYSESLMDFYINEEITLNYEGIIKCIHRHLHYLQKYKRGKEPKAFHHLVLRKKILK